MPRDESRDPADLLRQHGLQVTAQRLAVLRAVEGNKQRAAQILKIDRKTLARKLKSYESS